MKSSILSSKSHFSATFSAVIIAQHLKVLQRLKNIKP